MKSFGLAGKTAQAFIDSKLTPLIVGASVLLGLGAVVLLPREEEPQIIVPMIDVFVQMPGASAKEVEERVTKPMEKLLWEVPGVEYIYSTSSPGFAMAIVRFYVGEDEADAIVRLNQKMFANFDLIPPGASPPLVKPRSIDDVPILSFTLWSQTHDHFTLRKVAAQLHDEIKQVSDVSEVTIIGGQRRQVKVVLDAAKMAAYGVAPAGIVQRLELTNQESASGSFSSVNQEFLVETGGFLRDASEVRRVVISVHDGRPVFLADVARIEDGPEEVSNYVLFGLGPAAEFSHDIAGRSHQELSDLAGSSGSYPAVTISVSKRKGTNATVIANRVIEKVESSRAALIPNGIEVTVTRNYGETAKEKSDELLFHMMIAIVSVTVLIWFTLGSSPTFPMSVTLLIPRFIVTIFRMNKFIESTQSTSQLNHPNFPPPSSAPF